MKYRKTAIAAAVAVGAIALTACSSSDDTSPTTGGGGNDTTDWSGHTLTVMHYEGDTSAMGIAWNRAI